ncbi:ABC-F family ATP-binding cassette domain-containing protein [Gracilibacillus sp. S3-1-1]|uniref:ABC-F family ATP-binding cassette domain-containing protein n=1 Tax=Gracilibacillus pellucidus TaxID=3095368 RepID=A0ACC6M2H6_9BACI|nr:ABC-F family ATP-binding cassette domain-containing protein [Gracilibacillus sp. S3-1-1]MDX8045080.1 ABC-F family ATP-binding cassette domain-containing protein [Gracilibacillus sp. S3-1-1]
MRTIKIENLVKTYGEKVLFDGISFAITDNDRIGLIGVNGTGKSTLLKVIAGMDQAEAGTTTHPNDYRIEYLDQDPQLQEEDTVLDHIYHGDAEIMVTLRQYESAVLALEKDPESEQGQQQLLHMQEKMDQLEAWEAMTVAKTILTKLGVPAFVQKIANLSGGQRKRVAIAKALIQPADLLILDEPTNHLDNNTIEWLEEFLPTYQGAILLVTHDRYFLNRITNRIFELDKGKLYTYEGNYETFLEQKALREEQEWQAEQKHKNILKKEIAWLKAGVKARTTKQKARIDRVHQMKEKTFDTNKEQLDFQVGSTRLGKKVMEIKGLSKQYNGKVLFKDFDFLLNPGDRIGIVGANGSGKTTLLNMLAGRIQPDAGTIDVGETVKIGYYTQNHPALDDDVKIIDLVRDVAEVVHTVDGSVITAEQMLERFLFPRSQQWTYVRKLSGGERRRLYLLTVLMQEPNVLFLDEPTNDLDTETLAVLEDYLEQFPGVVITVSHDRYFLDKTVEQIIAFTGSETLTFFYGNYSAFREEAQALELKQVKQAPKQKPKRQKKKLSYHEQKEWETIEDEIAELEAELEQIEIEIAEAGSDIGKIQPLYNKQGEVEEQLEVKMARWEELSLLIEEMKEES